MTMSPDTQLGVSIILLIAGHLTLWRWSDVKHRRAGAAFMTAAWFFASGVGIEQFSQCSRLLNARADASQGKEMEFDPEQWSWPIDGGGKLTFTGAKPKVDERWHVNQNSNL